MSIKKYIINYQYFEEIMKDVVSHLKPLKFDFVYGPPRGGFPISVHLSHHLDIPLLKIPKIMLNTSFIKDKKLLICDDICDSGETLSKIQNIFSHYIKKEDVYFAVLHYKKRSKFEPDYYYEILDNNDWVTYPWERIDEEPDKDYMFEEKL